MTPQRLLLVIVAVILCPAMRVSADAPSPLPGTKPLTLSGDIASQLVEGVDRFLLSEIEKSVARRAKHWRRDTSSADAYAASIEPNRKRLAHILGVRDGRVDPVNLELRCAIGESPVAGRDEDSRYEIYAVRWPAFGDVHGEGLWIVPASAAEPVANVICIPDADQTPEMIAGLAAGVPAQSQFARRLAENGCRVLVPALVSRKTRQRGRVRLTDREYVYRSAFELGRHIIGYELQKVLAAVDWLAGQSDESYEKIAVAGYGEGGMLALYAGALDSRIDAVCVSGYFDSRNRVWQEPIDRNVFALLAQFGDAELAAMIAPRPLVIEAAKGPPFEIPPGTGGAPGRLQTPNLEEVRRECQRARQLVRGLDPEPRLELVVSGDGTGSFCSAAALRALLESLVPGATLAESRGAPEPLRKSFDPASRQERQVHELDRHNQWLLGESPYVRKQFMEKLDYSSLEKYQESVEWYREFFRNEVIGRFDYQPLEPNPRSRRVYDEPKWAGYEVVLDVFPDVIAYGVLLLPKDVRPGERRPVVVCQHGLEGRPQQTITGDHRAYHDFAAKLAERGFITFAPQNLYIFGDRFRTLQRKANPLGNTLFSIVVAQHQQIVDWLGGLPQVDPDRIGFYGLSYGGKTAMRVPPLVQRYCLSICSADFNDWVWKNAATNTRGRYSYVFTGEYEIFEFDLGSTFNYAEMAALIAPRPFMVERGHFDGVAPDERVAYEFAKVRHVYQAKLGIGDRCAIEWFVGPHTIHGQGTFDFLHKHLAWPGP